ncbi:MAG: sigma-54-dependent transcriptional regulator [bacterium]
MDKKILVVDDKKSELEAMVEALQKMGYRVFPASGGQEALNLFEDVNPDVIITDIKMPDIDGMELLKTVTGANPYTQVILITGYPKAEDTVKAADIGAFFYLPKPISIAILRETVKRALENQDLRIQNVHLQQQVDEKYGFSNILGNSKPMQEIFRTIKLVAPTRATVLISGDSGTGKELIARAIHNNSPRKKNLFQPVNCAAIPKDILESELFGHEPGAFTGAIGRRRGYFELADGGTIFLDEIGEMSSDMQVKLLRVLEEREFMRIGGTQMIKADVRIISATNKNLDKAMKDGDFREDLYYRLSGFTINVPPLRERREDIPILVYAFIQQFSEENEKRVTKITRPAMELLTKYDWPGNVRELRNEIEKAVIVCNSNTIDVDDLSGKIGNTQRQEMTLDVKVGMAMDEIEKVAIQKTLLETGGNKTRAADILKIPLRTFYRMLDKYGLSGNSKNKEESSKTT